MIGTNASITLDAANATTGQITMQKLSAGAGITVSMGTLLRRYQPGVLSNQREFHSRCV